MNLTQEIQKAIVIKNTHIYSAVITMYQGNFFSKTQPANVIYRVLSTNSDTARQKLIKQYGTQIVRHKANFHDFSLSTSYIISGAGTLSCNLTIDALPSPIVRAITRDQATYYFDNIKNQKPAFTIKIEIETNNCGFIKPMYYLISSAKIISSSYPRCSLQINGVPTLDTLNMDGYVNVQSAIITQDNGATLSATTVFDIKKAIAEKYNRGYVSLDPEGDSKYFEYPENGVLYVEDLLTTLNTLFPEQQHEVSSTTIISMKRQQQMTRIGDLNTSTSLLNDQHTTEYRSAPTKRYLLKKLQTEFLQKRGFLYHEDNNVIYNIITLQGVMQINVDVAHTPSIKIGDKVILYSRKNDYNKMYNKIYYVQSVVSNFVAKAHDPSTGRTNLQLCDLLSLTE